jgi:hypothetical protein
MQLTASWPITSLPGSTQFKFCNSTVSINIPKIHWLLPRVSFDISPPDSWTECDHFREADLPLQMRSLLTALIASVHSHLSTRVP